jgi:signal transduction histidine kinase
MHIAIMSDNRLEVQIKAACQITGACWAAWVVYEEPYWYIKAACRLDKPAREALRANLLTDNTMLWLNGALAAGRDRSRPLVSESRLKGNKMQVFPVQGARDAVLVGIDEVKPEAQRVWRLVTGTISVVAFGDAQYKRLQKALQDLQEAQQELQARIAAQQAAESRMMQTAKLAAVGEMAAGVAHELNNPLTTVVGFSELVMEDLPPDAPQHSDMEVVLREARRARDVVRRLLDFSRRSEMVRAQADINEIVEDTLGLMNHLLHTNRIEVRTRLEKDIPWVMVDQNQMKQVFLNLFTNAMNAMPEGGRLTITSRLQPRYGIPHISISVRDTGSGISPENLDRIFEPFFTTRAGKGGTGLGLSVTFGIISEHGGAIEVESAPGAGSTFTTWLPVEVQG